MDVPETAQLWLTKSNARFMRSVADKHFEGDRELALNAIVEYARTMLSEPEDRWKALTGLNDQRPRRGR